MGHPLDLPLVNIKSNCTKEKLTNISSLKRISLHFYELIPLNLLRKKCGCLDFSLEPKAALSKELVYGF